MSITIPDELAKRVLEAFDMGAGKAVDDAMKTRYPLYPAVTDRRLVAIANRDAEFMTSVRDELAALLTPKEAT